jgi:hypothetical protein
MLNETKKQSFGNKIFYHALYQNSALFTLRGAFIIS